MPKWKDSSSSKSSKAGFKLLKEIQKAKNLATGAVWKAAHELEGKMVRALGIVKRVSRKVGGGRRGNKNPERAPSGVKK